MGCMGYMGYTDCMGVKELTVAEGGLVLLVVLVLVIEKPRKAEDEHENEDDQEGFT